MFSLIAGAIAQVTPEDLNLIPDTGENAGLGIERLQDLSVGEIIGGLITLALIVAAVVFFFMLVFGGIQWILSGGDKQATENARSRITSALIGLVIVFAAWAISTILATFFNIEILKNLTLPQVEKTRTETTTGNPNPNVN